MTGSGYYNGRKIVVTGGSGFIGSHLCEELCLRGAEVLCASGTEGHLKTSPLKGRIKFRKTELFGYKECTEAFKGADMVMHLAARVGGIRYNMGNMAGIYADNLLMTSAVTKSVIEAGVKSALFVSSACVYPHDAIIPTPESEGFRGEPEETNEGYGWAKRALELSARYLQKYKNVKCTVVRPFNTYGPRDKFGIEEAHIVAGLINKVFSSVDGKIKVWGSGNQTRSLLYVKDAVRGMLEIAEKSTTAEPVNIGSDSEHSVKEIAQTIIEESGLQIEAVYDTSMPEGYERRASDNTKAKEMTGFKAEWGLREGIRETIKYYMEFVLKK